MSEARRVSRACVRCGTLIDVPARGSAHRYCPECKAVRLRELSRQADERRPRRCTVCASYELVTSTRCAAHTVVALRNAAPIDGATRYDDDPACQAFVNAHADGADLAEIAAALGLSYERVRQLVDIAVRKLRRRMPLVGVSAEDLAAYLASKDRQNWRSA